MDEQDQQPPVKKPAIGSYSGMRLLSQHEMMQRLHRYNLTKDYSVFHDVPPEQHVSIQYPDLLRKDNETDEEFKQRLVITFGPLDQE